MFSITPFFGQHRAGRALNVAVAVVKDLMVAGVRSAAGSVARRRFGTTSDRWIDDPAAAMAPKLVERNVGTHAAVAGVTELGTSRNRRSY